MISHSKKEKNKKRGIKMNYVKKDEHYNLIIQNIIEHPEFIKIDQYKHHGRSRLDHSIRVSYFSYKAAKLLGMKTYEEAARAGLLHDFFLEEVNNRFASLFKHPKIASFNASNHFELSAKEINVIETHMFPIIPRIPRHSVSWLVSLVDKGVAIGEVLGNFKYATNVLIVFVLNLVTILK